MFSMALAFVCMCHLLLQKQVFKSQENAVFLSSVVLCSSALPAFQSWPGRLKPSRRAGVGRAACDCREAEEILYTQAEMHTCRRTVALLSSNTGASYKETPLWLSWQTEVALGRGRWLNWPTREGNFKKTSKMKRWREKEKEGWGKMKMSRRLHLLLSIWTLH